MNKNRLEAFSDGVMAIILTIMVLELKIPEGDDFSSIISLSSLFFIYILSFIYVGLYWNNHHNLFHSAKLINGKVMWANLYLLFWMSLIPVSTAWVGKHPWSAWPAAVYGMVLFASATAHYLLVHVLLKTHECKTAISMSIGNDWKGRISLVMYLLGIGLSFYNTVFAFIIYFLVTSIWIIPDDRFKKISS